MREALELIGIIYKCPKTNEEVKIENKDYSLRGSSWGDDETESGMSVKLEIFKCPSCNKNHNEVVECY